jgi:general secretion pathway protein K
LFHKAIGYVTVRSKRAAPDAATASPALRQILDLDRVTSPPPPPGEPAATDLTIRADVSAIGGERFIREALVSIGADNGQAYVIHEWRRGTLDLEAPASRQTGNARQSAKACFKLGRRSNPES